ncbi:MAG: DUF3455 domain-containing protein [Acidobacteria bacterium]|nr:DUF3455 domain-containing protein [Acidobacteriota bacterium]
MLPRHLVHDFQRSSLLSKTTFIQRVNTAGGVAPTTACTDAGAIAFVPYTTDYIFYRAAH